MNLKLAIAKSVAKRQRKQLKKIEADDSERNSFNDPAPRLQTVDMNSRQTQLFNAYAWFNSQMKPRFF